VRKLKSYWFVVSIVAGSMACSKEEVAETPDSSEAEAAAGEAPAPAVADPERFPEIVATVNATQIHKAELLERAAGVASRDPGTEDTTSVDFFRGVLNDLISAELLYQASQEKNIEVDRAAVERQLAALRSRFPDPSLFEQALAQQGMTLAELEAQMERDMSIQKFIESDIAPRVSVSEEEKRQFYDGNQEQMRQPEELRLSHILKQVAPDATPDVKQATRARIEEILREVQAGGDFAALAREHSDDPGSAANGGEMVVRRGQTVPPFEAAAFALEPGGVSPVVETRFGFHIIKLSERTEGVVMPYEQVHARIEEFLRQQELRAEVETTVDSLQEAAKVERFI